MLAQVTPSTTCANVVQKYFAFAFFPIHAALDLCDELPHVFMQSCWAVKMLARTSPLPTLEHLTTGHNFKLPLCTRWVLCPCLWPVLDLLFIVLYRVYLSFLLQGVVLSVLWDVQWLLLTFSLSSWNLGMPYKFCILQPKSLRDRGFPPAYHFQKKRFKFLRCIELNWWPPSWPPGEWSWRMWFTWAAQRARWRILSVR